MDSIVTLPTRCGVGVQRHIANAGFFFNVVSDSGSLVCPNNMRQFVTIAGNAFMELIRQPVYLLLMTLSTLFEIGLACVNYFGFGDEPKLVKNTALAVMLLTGLFGAVLSASASVAREIRSGT